MLSSAAGLRLLWLPLFLLLIGCKKPADLEQAPSKDMYLWQ